MSREVGSNFDKGEADKIFDALDKIDSETVKKNNAFETQIKDVSQILKEAKSCDDTKACELYKKVLVIMPENVEAYIALADIYRRQNDSEQEKDILKKAIQNVDGNQKDNLIKRLKDI